MELKRALLAEADRFAADDAIVCSSTSGLRPTELQAAMAAAGAVRRRPSVQPRLPAAARRGVRRRCDVGRRRSSARGDVYRSVGMQPLARARRRSTASSPTGCSRRCGARRSGSSTTASRRSRRSTTRSATAPGCAGRSWARSSPTGSPAARPGCATSWPSSGRRSQWPWTKLIDVPELTDDLLDRLVAQSDAQAAGRSMRELERERDDAWSRSCRACAVWERVRGRRCSPGSAGCSARRRPGQGACPPRGSTTTATCTRAATCRRSPMRPTRCSGRSALDPSVGSYFTVETHLSHLRPLHAGDLFHVTTEVLGVDEKRLRLSHVLHRDGEADAGRDRRADARARRRRVGPCALRSTGACAERVEQLPR